MIPTKCLRVVGVSLLLFPPFASKADQSSVTLNVVTFNYCSRPIYDVFIDGSPATAQPLTLKPAAVRSLA